MRLPSGAGSSLDVACRRCHQTDRHEHTHYRHRPRARRRRTHQHRSDNHWSHSLGRKEANGGIGHSVTGRVVLAAVVHSHSLAADELTDSGARQHGEQVQDKSKGEMTPNDCCDRLTSGEQSSDCQLSSSSSSSMSKSKDAESSCTKISKQQRAGNKLSRLFTRNRRTTNESKKGREQQETELIDKPHCNEYNGGERNTLDGATATATARNETVLLATNGAANPSDRVRNGNCSKSDFTQHQQQRQQQVSVGDKQTTTTTTTTTASSGESCVGGAGTAEQVIEFKFDLIVDDEQEGADCCADSSRLHCEQHETACIKSSRSRESDRSTRGCCSPVESSDRVGKCRRGLSSGGERKLADNVNELIEAFVLDSNDVCLMTTGKQRLTDLNAADCYLATGAPHQSDSKKRPLCQLLRPSPYSAANSDDDDDDEFEQINRLAAKAVAYAFRLLQQAAGKRVEAATRSNHVDHQPVSDALAEQQVSVQTNEGHDGTEDYCIEIGATLFLQEPTGEKRIASDTAAKATKTDDSLFDSSKVNVGMSMQWNTTQFSIIDLVDGGEVCADNRNGSNVIECKTIEEALSCTQRLRNNLRQLLDCSDNRSRCSSGSIDSNNLVGGREKPQQRQQQQQQQQTISIDTDDECKKFNPNATNPPTGTSSSSKKVLVISFKLKQRINGGLFSNRMCLIDFDSNFVELRCIFESIFNGQALAHLNRRKVYLQELESELANSAALCSASLNTANRNSNSNNDNNKQNKQDSNSIGCGAINHNCHLDLLEKQHHQVASLNKLVQAEWLLYKLLSSVLIRTLIIVHVHRLVSIDTASITASASVKFAAAEHDTRVKSLDSATCAGNGDGVKLDAKRDKAAISTTTNPAETAAAAAAANGSEFNYGHCDSSKNKSLRVNRMQVEQRLMDINLDALEFARSLQRASTSRLKRRKQHLKSHHLISPPSILSLEQHHQRTTSSSTMMLMKSNELVVHHSSPIRVKHKRTQQQQQVWASPETPTRFSETKSSKRLAANAQLNDHQSLRDYNEMRASLDNSHSVGGLQVCDDVDRIISRSNQVVRSAADHNAHDLYAPPPTLTTAMNNDSAQRVRHLLYSYRNGNLCSGTTARAKNTVVGGPTDQLAASRQLRAATLFQHQQQRADATPPTGRFSSVASDLADSCSLSPSTSDSQSVVQWNRQADIGNQSHRRPMVSSSVQSRCYDDTSLNGSSEQTVTCPSARYNIQNCGTTAATTYGNFSDSDSVASTNLNSYSSSARSISQLRRKRSVTGLLSAFVGPSSPQQNDIDLESITSSVQQRHQCQQRQHQLHPLLVDATEHLPIELRPLDTANIQLGTNNLAETTVTSAQMCSSDTMQDRLNNPLTGNVAYQQQADYETDSAMLDDNVSDVVSMVAEPPRQLKLEEFLTHLSSFIVPAGKTSLTSAAADATGGQVDDATKLMSSRLLQETKSSSHKHTTANNNNNDLSDRCHNNNVIIPELTNRRAGLSLYHNNNGLDQVKALTDVGENYANAETNKQQHCLAVDDIEDEDCKSHSSILERLCSLALESSSRVRLNGSASLNPTACPSEQVELAGNDDKCGSLSRTADAIESNTGEMESSLQTDGHLKRLLDSSHQLQKTHPGLRKNNTTQYSQQESSSSSTENRLKALIIECQANGQPRLAGSVASSSISSTESNCSSPQSSTVDRICGDNSSNTTCNAINHEKQIQGPSGLCGNILRHQKLRT